MAHAKHDPFICQNCGEHMGASFDWGCPDCGWQEGDPLDDPDDYDDGEEQFDDEYYTEWIKHPHATPQPERTYEPPQDNDF